MQADALHHRGMKKLVTSTVGLVALVGGAAAAALPPAGAWTIGPIIRGKNYSVGMPMTLQQGPQGPGFAFPAAGRGSVHYVSLDTGPLEGARSITVRYRIDAAPGTRFVAEQTGAPGQFGLVFQRAGDNWSAKGRYETYRWYSPRIVPLKAGVSTFTVSLADPDWVGVQSSHSGTSAQAFAAALADTESVSMTFGSAAGRGHGVYATGPARFTLLDFRID